jgi:large subunit ribosomal protein L15
MKLHLLPKTTTKTKRRAGQGHGSGRVKTGGRGTKGQNARSSRALYFEGGAVPLTKRLPFMRGKGKNKPRPKQLVINTAVLNALPKGSVVDVKALIQARLVDAKRATLYGVKVLGNGNMSVALTVKIPVSKGAAEKIEKAGGRVEAGKNKSLHG